MKTACDDCGELYEPDELRLIDGLRICEECAYADHGAGDEDELEAEQERLKQALHEILGWCTQSDGTSDEQVVHAVERIARKALQPD